ncbi:MAG: hypothetical protein K6E96_02620 [Bacteroidales bacterium]|nr:hypothetical protein [Bacteroidales bacterium]
MKKLILALMFVAALGTVAAQGFKVTNTSVGPLKIGMAVGQIPASVDGLYDRFVKEDDHINFYQGEDLVIRAEEFYLGNGLSKISAYEKANVSVVVLGKTYKMGDNIKALKSNPHLTYWPNTGTISVGMDLDLGTTINPDHRSFGDLLTRITVIAYEDEYDY